MLRNPAVQKETSSLSHVAQTPAFFFLFVEEIKVVIEWTLMNGCSR